MLLHIEDEPCIRCGQCLQVCPHGAIKVNGEIGRALAIAAQGEGVLILSPESVAHFYPATPEQVINGCYQAGFRAVTRGVIGDELVAAEYLKLWEEEPWGHACRHCPQRIQGSSSMWSSNGSSAATAMASVGQTRTQAKQATQSSASMTKFKDWSVEGRGSIAI